jgi:tetratricopeptide (TPR) repeat protein
LNVNSVLEGSVRRQGRRLRVTAQLNSARDGYQYWSKVWDRDLTDVFAIQDEVARGVVESVNSDVGPNTPLVHPPTRDLEAYNLYLQGRFYEHRVYSTEKAMDYFRRAIEKDSGFALAYTGLATCYADLGYYHQASPGEVYPQAVAALRKALELDPSLARALALEGLISLLYDWDWPTADRKLRRAMELNPGDAEVHDFYSHFLVTLGRFDESLTESQRAIEIDPLDQVRLGHLAWHYLMARKPRYAVEVCQQALDIDPRHVPSLVSLQRGCEALGRFDKAIEAAAQRGVVAEVVKSLRERFAAEGPQGYWRAWREWLIARSGKERVAAGDIASVLTRLGDKEEAIEWLERGFRERDSWLVYLNVEPAFEELCGDARFQDLLKRIGIPRAPELGCSGVGFGGGRE